MSSPIHRLSAIVFTDIVGYTSMMGENEDVALKTLEINREIHQKYFRKFHSTYQKQIGDGFLGVFDSVIQAAHACSYILQDCKAANINIRIGIHEGEVIFKDNDVYGDEVNIASRIESAAESCSIYVSENVKRNLDNKTGFSVEFIKEFELKNVKDSMNLYALKVDIEKLPDISSLNPVLAQRSIIDQRWFKIGTYFVIGGLILFLLINYDSIYDSISGSKKQKEINLSEKSIAVLPFQNFSNDSTMDYLGDGFADHIINNLSRIPDFRVIARASSFRFKKSDKTIHEIAEELGVQNVLEGSFQIINDQIHLNLNLIHGISGEILFSDTYEGLFSQLFQLQDKVAVSFSGSLVGSFIKFIDPPKKEREIDLEAFKFYQYGQSLLKENYIYRNTILESRKLFQKASKIDPEWSAPYVGMAESFLLELHYGYTVIDRVQDSIEFYVERVSAINPDHGELYSLKGTLAFWNSNLKEAILLYNKAIEINPNYPYSHYFMGYIYVNYGDLEKALAFIDKAISLDPLNEMFKTVRPLWISLLGKHKEAELMLLEMLEKEPGENTTLFILGMVYTMTKEYDKAINALLKRSVGQKTNWLLAFNYAKTGQEEKAREIMDYLIRLPDDRSPPKTMMAITYLGFEEYDKAMDYMDKGFDTNDLWFIWIEQSWSDPIKNDPRYKRILEAYREKIK